jgi:hypothetical protein
VDKLFDEMKELSRRIDQRNAQPQQPLPPIVVNMQQPAGGPPPQRPIIMDLPSAQPQAEGLPRYAAADAFEEEAGPPPRRPPTQQRSPGRPTRQPPPRPREPVPFAAEAPAPAAPAAEEVPRGWPGLGPFTDNEPEPQLESRVHEVPEAELEPLDDEGPPMQAAEPPAAEALATEAPAEETPVVEAPAGEAPTEAPAAEEPLAEVPASRAREPVPADIPGEEVVLEEGPEPGVTAEQPARPPAPGVKEPGARPEPAQDAEDVRKGLRDYLHGVQDKLDAGREKQPGPGGLLDYLGKLSDYLPERDKKRFRGSPERLAMEALKAQLAGKKGLRRRVASDFPAVAPRRKEPMTRSLVVDTFSYLKDLSAWHPDKAVGAAMRQSIEAIVARMGRS